MMSRGQGGQATIELALCLPLLAALAGAIMWVAGIATDHVRVWHAAREAARIAAVDADIDAIEGAATAGGLEDLDVVVEPAPEARTRGEAVTVTVSYRPAVGIPLLGVIAPGLVMSAHSTMRIERP